MQNAKMDIQQRLLARTDMPGGDNCWEWKGALDSRGYGRISINGLQYRTHRLSWELTHGGIPRGKDGLGSVIAHKCDNPKCLRPDHLFLATQRENMRDKIVKGRARWGA